MINSSTPKQYVYSGTLAPIINSYINEKRGMGVKFEAGAKLLKNFDRFSQGFVFPCDTLPEELMIAYVAKRPGESDSNRNLRIGTIRRFAEYMRRCNYTAYVVPNKMYPKQSGVYAPYIFSELEIGRIFEVADNLDANPQNRHLCVSAPILFRMYYSCGMRASEVMNLTVSDIDLANGVIRIRETKFNKSRYTPMSESLWAICTEFAKVVHPIPCEDAPFFPNPRNDFFKLGAMYALFRKVLWKAGISHGGPGKGPRLHDLRHTFAVHCLKQWSLNGVDLAVALPYLSAYLGHTGLSSTQKYLRLTADVFPYITSSLNDKFGYLIPEIGGELNEE
jgi:integrase